MVSCSVLICEISTSNTRLIFIDSTQNDGMIMSSNTSCHEMVLVCCNACGLAMYDDFCVVWVLVIDGVFKYKCISTNRLFLRKNIWNKEMWLFLCVKLSSWCDFRAQNMFCTLETDLKIAGMSPSTESFDQSL